MNAKEITCGSSGLTRRRLLGAAARAVAGTAIVAALPAGCRADSLEEKNLPLTDGQSNGEEQAAAEGGRLRARPSRVKEQAQAGLHPLKLDDKRDALIYVPAGYKVSRPSPLAVMLHGAGGDAGHGMSLLRDLADEGNMILLAPASRRQTWDVIMGGYGADVAFIDRALALVFSRYAVDPARLAVGGFSDGASYALSLGLTNGDLFPAVIAFSPGFLAPAAQRGRPRLFVSHGTRDDVLPIKVCSRKIVPQVKRAGYDVLYQEFDGGHTIPSEIRRAAVNWFLGREA